MSAKISETPVSEQKKEKMEERSQENSEVAATPFKNPSEESVTDAQLDDSVKVEIEESKQQNGAQSVALDEAENVRLPVEPTTESITAESSEHKPEKNTSNAMDLNLDSKSELKVLVSNTTLNATEELSERISKLEVVTEESKESADEIQVPNISVPAIVHSKEGVEVSSSEVSMISVATTPTGASSSYMNSLSDLGSPTMDTENRSKKITIKSSSGPILSNNRLGTQIDEDHANFALMYDMLTGIRVSVSRCEAKPPRSVNSDDFKNSHKLAFDMTGNELTPSSKYDFKFKDYAPWIFRQIREAFKIDAAEYLVSLTGQYRVSEMGSPGKSGSFFYYSQDGRFIIKTIHHAEHMFMRKIMKHYHDHVTTQPNTLICRILGLHRVKLPFGKKIHFVVMGNVMPSNKDIHELYDLKGSTHGRRTPDDVMKKKPSSVMKDLNWLEKEKHLKLGPLKKEIFIKQLEIDTNFLIGLNIMDYSLLAGIHYISRGNSEMILGKSIAVFNPKTEDPKLSKSAVFKAVTETDPVPLDPSATMSDVLPSERKNFFFYQDDGGFISTDEDNNHLDELYFLGIIDILTPYTVTKKFEHFFKSVRSDKNAISAVPAPQYGERFLKFMKTKVLK